jgi:5-formyltetrahydrofolate cyclo-ligase
MIAIATASARFYYDAAEELKKRGLDFYSLKVGEAVPQRVKVVLTTPGEAQRIDFPRVIADRDPRLAVEKAVRLAKGFKERHRRITVGIDPGRKPGVAILARNRAADVFTTSTPEEVGEVLRRVVSLHAPEELLVRLGSGGGVYRDRILKTLRKHPGLKIELVNEYSTSDTKTPSDASAALNIALKRGRPLSKTPFKTITPGEIKNIQRESRALSHDITISRSLAKKVAKGELSIREAIDIQRKRLK